MKCLFLYNPNGGRGTVTHKLRYVGRRLKKKYDEVTICGTRDAKDLEQKVREGASQYDAIVFSGGDGTFNNVLHGAEGTNVQLGYLPTGTVNDVARSLGIPRSVRGALRVVLKGRSERLDCIRVGEDRYAMYIAGAGAFTSATYQTPQYSKRTFGALAYAFEGVRHHMKLPVFPLRIVCGTQRLETDAVLIFVLNGRSVAGFPINRSGSMRDGELELVVIKQVSRPNFLQKLGKYFSVASLFLFGCRVRKRDIVYMRGKRFEIGTGGNVVWDFDGEEGTRGSVVLEVLSKQVRLFVPGRKKI